MPLGTAQEASAPSCSRRRSQCRRVAWCSWTTKRPAAAGWVAPSPAGSGVVSNCRFARYSARRSFATAGLAVRVLLRVGLAVLGARVLLLGERLVAHVDLDLGLGRAVLAVLDELFLGHLPALGLSAAGFVDGVHGGGVGEVLFEVARRPAADVARLGGRGLGLLVGESVRFVGHGQSLTYPRVIGLTRAPRRRVRRRPARPRAARSRRIRRGGARWRRGSGRGRSPGSRGPGRRWRRSTRRSPRRGRARRRGARRGRPRRAGDRAAWCRRGGARGARWRARRRAASRRAAR